MSSLGLTFGIKSRIQVHKERSDMCLLISLDGLVSLQLALVTFSVLTDRLGKGLGHFCLKSGRFAAKKAPFGMIMISIVIMIAGPKSRRLSFTATLPMTLLSTVPM